MICFQSLSQQKSNFGEQIKIKHWVERDHSLELSLLLTVSNYECFVGKESSRNSSMD